MEELHHMTIGIKQSNGPLDYRSTIRKKCWL